MKKMKRSKESTKDGTKPYISRMCQATPSEGIRTNFGASGDLTDLSDVQNFMSISEGVQILHGVKKRMFP
jgi:hypothetical protein